MPPKIRHTNTFRTSCKCNEQKNTSIKGKEMPDIGVKGCPLSPTLFSFYIDEFEHIWMNVTEILPSLFNVVVSQSSSISLQTPLPNKGPTHFINQQPCGRHREVANPTSKRALDDIKEVFHFNS